MRRRKILEEKMLSFLKDDPRKMSAELNSFFSYLSEFNPKIEHIHLMVSDTPEGKFSARVLERYLEDRGYRVSKHTIEGFGTGNLKLALEKLKEDVRSILKRYENPLAKIFGGTKVVLNLTGGLKGEVASLAVLAAEKWTTSLLYARRR